MERHARLGLIALGALGLGLGWAPVAARAQAGGGVGPVSPYSGTVWSGMAVNPLMNPYANPYLNPMVAQDPSQQMSAGAAAMYFLAARQMTGGVGSGRLGGPYAGTQPPGAAAAPGRAVGPWGQRTAGRAGPTALAATGPEPGPAAGAARRGGANAPGGTAARFFDRDYPTKLNSTRYYGRQNTHFPYPGK